jgi:hypothetical protein
MTMNRSYKTSTDRATAAIGEDALTSTVTLALENARYAGTAGVSQGSRRLGFLPAFLDAGSGEVYLSRFADGRLAPIHMLDGLPEKLVVARSEKRITAVKASVIAGFVREHRFYTREQAALTAGGENKEHQRVSH